jgi:uncharacterized protein with ATP-grasp and redox domains
LVLYLTDNSGEIYFDQVLYKFLADRVKRAVLVVKGRPAMNDLTRADLEQSGVADEFTEVADTGGGAGVDWDEVSPEFMALVSEADLLVCKGLANFLTVFQYPLPCPAFFIYKAKCRPVEWCWIRRRICFGRCGRIRPLSLAVLPLQPQKAARCRSRRWFLWCNRNYGG